MQHMRIRTCAYMHTLVALSVVSDDRECVLTKGLDGIGTTL